MTTKRTVRRYSTWLRDEIIYNAGVSVKNHGLTIDGEQINPRVAARAVRDLLKRYTTTTQLLKAWPGLEERGLAYEFTIEDIEEIIKDWRESEIRRRKLRALHDAAPELLEALRQLRDYVEDVCAVSSSDCDKEHPLMLATAAINKALGEKQ